MSAQQQASLFPDGESAVPEQGECNKQFVTADGVSIAYITNADGTIRFILPDGERGVVTRQSGNRWYVPDFRNADGKNEKLQGRWAGKGNSPKTPLSVVAARWQIREAIRASRQVEAKAAIVRARERELEAEAEIARERERMLTERFLRESEDPVCAPIHTAGQQAEESECRPRRKGRHRVPSNELAALEFGPVIKDFKEAGIAEYSILIPSWLSRREELESSRKDVYAQLRRWFGKRLPGCTLLKSNSALAEQVGLNRVTVGRCLDDLVLHRLISLQGKPTGVRRVFFHVHPWMTDPGAVPTWHKFAQVAPDSAHSGDQVERKPVQSCSRTRRKFEHKDSEKTDIKSESSERECSLEIASPREPTRHVLPKKRREEGSARFARDGEDLPDDELWRDLCRLLGFVELTQNGALWERRLRTGRSALIAAVQDFQTKSPEERAKHNAGAYVTAAYENELRRS